MPGLQMGFKRSLVRIQSPRPPFTNERALRALTKESKHTLDQAGVWDWRAFDG
jgi:hypothetical protein